MSLTSNELIRTFEREMQGVKNYSHLDDRINPCHVKLNNVEYYVYVKNLSPAYFHNKDVSRAQLTDIESLHEIKKSDAIFIFLGYDAENDVYATWNPYMVKQRIGTAASPSLYSRFSWQHEAALKSEFIKNKLKNDCIVLLFPRKLILQYMANIDMFFPDKSKYVAIGSKRRKKVNVSNSGLLSNNPNIEIDYETPYLDKNGCLTKIANPKLLDLLRNDLDCEYPQYVSAYNTIEDFYGKRFPKMEFYHWSALLEKIDWKKPYPKPSDIKKPKYRKSSTRKKIYVKFPNGKIVCDNMVFKTLIAVIKYAGVDKVLKCGIRTGEKSETSLIVDKINPNYREVFFKPLGNGLYINTCSSTNVKYKQIKQIKEKLNLQLEIKLITLPHTSIR